MSAPTATSRPRPGAAVNIQVTVADYLATQAGEAARGVRLAGLRPAVDRQVGHPAESAGLVVAQEPPGGETLPRGGMVTLYVAAPAASETAVPEPEGEQRFGCAAEVSADRSPAVSTARGGSQRNSTPAGRADRRPTVSFLRAADLADAGAITLGAAAPARRHRQSEGERSDASAEHATRPPSLDAVAARHAPTDRAAARKPSDEIDDPSDQPRHDTDCRLELAQSMRDAFTSGGGRLGKGRVYPREPLSLRLNAAGALLRRRWRRVLAGVAVLAWLTFALAHRGQTERPAAPVPSVAATMAGRRLQGGARPHRAGHAHLTRAARRRARLRAVPATRRRRPTGPARATHTASPPVQPAQTAPVPETRAPTDPGGGPFSP